MQYQTTDKAYEAAYMAYKAAEYAGDANLLALKTAFEDVRAKYEVERGMIPSTRSTASKFDAKALAEARDKVVELQRELDATRRALPAPVAAPGVSVELIKAQNEIERLSRELDVAYAQLKLVKEKIDAVDSTLWARLFPVKPEVKAEQDDDDESYGDAEDASMFEADPVPAKAESVTATLDPVKSVTATLGSSGKESIIRFAVGEAGTPIPWIGSRNVTQTTVNVGTLMDTLDGTTFKTGQTGGVNFVTISEAGGVKDFLGALIVAFFSRFDVLASKSKEPAVANQIAADAWTQTFAPLVAAVVRGIARLDGALQPAWTQGLAEILLFMVIKGASGRSTDTASVSESVFPPIVAAFAYGRVAEVGLPADLVKTRWAQSASLTVACERLGDVIKSKPTQMLRLFFAKSLTTQISASTADEAAAAYGLRDLGAMPTSSSMDLARGLAMDVRDTFADVATAVKDPQKAGVAMLGVAKAFRASYTEGSQNMTLLARGGKAPAWSTGTTIAVSEHASEAERLRDALINGTVESDAVLDLFRSKLSTAIKKSPQAASVSLFISDADTLKDAKGKTLFEILDEAPKGVQYTVLVPENAAWLAVKKSVPNASDIVRLLKRHVLWSNEAIDLTKLDGRELVYTTLLQLDNSQDVDGVIKITGIKLGRTGKEPGLLVGYAAHNSAQKVAILSEPKRTKTGRFFVIDRPIYLDAPGLSPSVGGYVAVGLSSGDAAQLPDVDVALRADPTYAALPKPIAIATGAKLASTQREASDFIRRGGLVDQLKAGGSLLLPPREELADMDAAELREVARLHVVTDVARFSNPTPVQPSGFDRPFNVYRIPHVLRPSSDVEREALALLTVTGTLADAAGATLLLPPFDAVQALLATKPAADVARRVVLGHLTRSTTLPFTMLSGDVVKPTLGTKYDVKLPAGRLTVYRVPAILVAKTVASKSSMSEARVVQIENEAVALLAATSTVDVVKASGYDGLLLPPRSQISELLNTNPSADAMRALVLGHLVKVADVMGGGRVVTAAGTTVELGDVAGTAIQPPSFAAPLTVYRIPAVLKSGAAVATAISPGTHAETTKVIRSATSAAEAIAAIKKTPPTPDVVPAHLDALNRNLGLTLQDKTAVRAALSE